MNDLFNGLMDDLPPKVHYPTKIPENHYCRFESFHGDIVPAFYPIHHKTPSGVVIDLGFNDKLKFINNNWKKKYAYPTIKEAFDAFVYRRQKQVEILTYQLDIAKLELDLAKSFINTNMKKVI